MKNPINLQPHNVKEAREEKENYPHPTIRKFTITRTRLVTLIVITLSSVGLAFYFYFQTAELKRDPQALARKEIEQLVSRVGALIVLPEGEQPTMATVTDPEKLKDQPFFNNAKTGDKVLIYTNARKAILYDPVANKIIEVAPLNIGNK